MMQKSTDAHEVAKYAASLTCKMVSELDDKSLILMMNGCKCRADFYYAWPYTKLLLVRDIL